MGALNSIFTEDNIASLTNDIDGADKIQNTDDVFQNIENKQNNTSNEYSWDQCGKLKEALNSIFTEGNISLTHDICGVDKVEDDENNVLENMESNQNNASNEYSCDQYGKIEVANNSKVSKGPELNKKIHEDKKSDTNCQNKNCNGKSGRIDEYKNTDKDASNRNTFPCIFDQLDNDFDQNYSKIDSSPMKKSLKNKNNEQGNDRGIGINADKCNNAKFGKKPSNRSTQYKCSIYRNSLKSHERGGKDYELFKQKYIKGDESIDFRVVNEIEGDLFTAGVEYSLGHCVAEDMNMASGLAIKFRQIFKMVPELLDQRQTTGNVAILENNKRYIYYLVTKRVSRDKPTYLTMWSSLQKMKEHITANSVKKLALPRIGCGLNNLEWKLIKKMLEYIFHEVDIEIKIYNFQQKDDKSYEKFKQKYINGGENIDFTVVNEIQGDLFTAGTEYSLGHCVAEDMNMGSGIAVKFRQIFKRMPELLDQRQTKGNVAVLKDNKRYIYYLVTKTVSSDKSTYLTIWSSLQKMKEHITANSVKKLALPRIGCGLNNLEWKLIKKMLEYIFHEVDIEIKIYNFQQKDDKSYEKFKQKYINGGENIDFTVVNEIQGDLFTAASEYSLGHCVAEDMNMGSGIAVRFCQIFKRIPELLDQKQTSGNVAILEDNKRYIYYLVTKRVSSDKSTYLTMWSSLQKMKDHITANSVKKLALPRIGCGLNNLEWKLIKKMLEYIFHEVDIEIRIYNFQQNYGKLKRKLQTKEVK